MATKPSLYGKATHFCRSADTSTDFSSSDASFKANMFILSELKGWFSYGNAEKESRQPCLFTSSARVDFKEERMPK
ncbi:unnamed protein product [Arctogadus glacialis]